MSEKQKIPEIQTRFIGIAKNYLDEKFRFLIPGIWRQGFEDGKFYFKHVREGVFLILPSYSLKAAFRPILNLDKSHPVKRIHAQNYFDLKSDAYHKLTIPQKYRGNFTPRRQIYEYGCRDSIIISKYKLGEHKRRELLSGS